MSASMDTDCDGLNDFEEFSTVRANGMKTSACVADTDGDGLSDGLELGRTTTFPACAATFVPDLEPVTTTDPTNADTDGDGLSDGAEDKNKNGRVDLGEANPTRKDTDCDGINDATEVAGTLGCMTDPQKIDTDGDGLPDGVEQGQGGPGADPTNCSYPAALFDTEPATRTSACAIDADGDGVDDGVEDGNRNGKVDPGELDPANAADGAGPGASACATANLRPVTFQSSMNADLLLGLAPGFTEIGRLNDGSGEQGIIFFDPTRNIAGLTVTTTSTGADATAEELAGRAKFNTVAAISAPITQRFTTWDGLLAARGTYDHSGGFTDAGAPDLKTRINDLARAYLGGAATGLLTGAAGVVGPFKLQAQFTRRPANKTVVVIALTPISNLTGQNAFLVEDTAGGSSLAQFGDTSAIDCEVFTSGPAGEVDFLWVVDDSGSMQAKQAAVGNAANIFPSKLASAGVNWRAGGVTTGYAAMQCTAGTVPYCYRAFTSVTATMLSWFSSAGGTSNWFGTGGAGIEKPLESPAAYLGTALLPRTTNPADNKVRTTAALHLILLTDADEQGTQSIGALNAFFLNYDGAGTKAVVHGLVCPQGQLCGETQATPRKNLVTIAVTGGVFGDVNVAQTGGTQLTNTMNAILSAAINSTGQLLFRPAIASTIRVAIESGGTVGTCNTSDVPHDRTHGYDFDAANRRLVFYGNCIPSAVGRRGAVSARSWIDRTP